MTDDQPEIDFTEDIKGVISLPWRQILIGAFLFGFLVSLTSFLAGLTGIIKQALLNYQSTGDLLNGEDPLMILFIFLLTILLITFATTFAVVGFMLINGSKTFQFLFLWSLVTLGYLILLLLTLCVTAILVLCLLGIFVEANWEFGVVGIVMLYPAWKLLRGSFYSLRNLSSVAQWVYQTTAKADVEPIN
ncbi:MAG: hypothetical protein P8K79_03270 [Mariniblastus sp.]|nr:hypothetical protein [Mariniblastus sp.]